MPGNSLKDLKRFDRARRAAAAPVAEQKPKKKRVFKKESEEG